jgi:hypothetical protein
MLFSSGWRGHSVAVTGITSGLGNLIPGPQNIFLKIQVRLTEPLDKTPTDERAGERQESLMNVGSALVTDAVCGPVLVTLPLPRIAVITGTSNRESCIDEIRVRISILLH